MTIHTIGCSFTEWIYPTWADYIAKYYNTDVINLGLPCAGNDVIKKNLFTIDESDHVIIMFSGYNRITLGVDQKYLTEMARQKKLAFNDIQNLKNGRCNFFRTNKPLTTFIKSEPDDHMAIYSNFHMMYNLLENMYDCQNYLQAKGISYTFCLWQGMYNDLSELRAINQPKIDLDDYEGFKSNKIFKKVYDSIDRDKFLQSLDKGIWEHLLSDKKLVLAQNKWDLHPSSLCHFDYFTKYMKPILDDKFQTFKDIHELESKAVRFSQYYADLDKSQLDSVFHNRSGLWTKDSWDQAKDFYFKAWGK